MQAARARVFPVRDAQGGLPELRRESGTGAVGGRKEASDEALRSGPSQALRFICSDMWKAYLRVVAKKAAQYERRKPRSFTPAVSSPSSPARVGCGSDEPADSARMISPAGR